MSSCPRSMFLFQKQKQKTLGLLLYFAFEMPAMGMGHHAGNGCREARLTASSRYTWEVSRTRTVWSDSMCSHGITCEACSGKKSVSKNKVLKFANASLFSMSKDSGFSPQSVTLANILRFFLQGEGTVCNNSQHHKSERTLLIGMSPSMSVTAGKWPTIAVLGRNGGSERVA